MTRQEGRTGLRRVAEVFTWTTLGVVAGLAILRASTSKLPDAVTRLDADSMPIRTEQVTGRLTSQALAAVFGGGAPKDTTVLVVVAQKD